MLDQSLVFDEDLIQRYDSRGPRYTSYPTAIQFHGEFGEEKYRAQASQSNGELIPRPLSLYFHLPFCNTVCYYCACNKIITASRKRAVPYLERLHKEIALQAELFDSDRQVDQLHWGGGTPTFINPEQMIQLMQVTHEHFNLRSDERREFSIEIDPREVDDDTFAVLKECGFNRISLGVQDVDPKVQQAVNRIQPVEQTEKVVNQARSEGFESISLDLIYGLPYQNRESFDRTLDSILTLNPDRLAIYNYAHLPHMFKVQRQMDEATLPTAAEKLDILRSTIEKLTDAGFVYIGMDHFAKPDNELAVAQREGKLYRNFQGYSTHADCDVIGLGVTSIGSVADCYSQNMRTEEEYFQRIDEGRLAIFRGVQFDADDKLRRDIISRLICNFMLDFSAIEKTHGIHFHDYFSEELAALQPMQSDGLLSIDEKHIEVLPAGRLLIRNVCMAFDAYLNTKTESPRFSKTV